MISEVYNIDCLEFMRQQPDNKFDLAIADPPYGISESGAKTQTRGNLAKPTFYAVKNWDDKSPDKVFFDELRRISKFQVVWGANHFISKIAIDSPCWLVWDKQNGNNDFADCELAWTNFPTAVRKFTFRWAGMLQGDMKNKESRIHPTQKPIALYHWILSNYGGGCETIFDPMMGSQSSRIAAWKAGFDFYGCELDKEYFEKGNERFAKECKGETKMANGQIVKQMTLF